MGRIRFRLSFLLVVSMMPARGDTYPRQTGVDAQHYTFHLTLRDDSDEIAGDATVDLRFVQSGIRQFSLDLASFADGKGMTVIEVTSPGGGL